MIEMRKRNLQTLCRTCLDHIQITSPSNFDIKRTPNLPKILLVFTSLNMSDETNSVLPQKICGKCYNKIQEFHDFRNMAQESNAVLRNIVEEWTRDAEIICPDGENIPNNTSNVDLIIPEPEIKMEYEIEFTTENNTTSEKNKTAEGFAIDSDSSVPTNSTAKKRKHQDEAYPKIYQRKVFGCKPTLATRKELEKHVAVYHPHAMSTPKKRTKTQEFDFNALLKAIKRCLLGCKGIRAASREFGVDKSSLHRHVKKVTEYFDDISSVSDDDLLKFICASHKKYPSNMVFCPAQENELVEYILKCVNHYYGLSIRELRELALQFAKKLNLEYPTAWNGYSKAGKTWFCLFIKRHPQLTLRTTEQTVINRKKAFCKENVGNFFANLGQLIDKYKFDFTAIYNMGESGFSAVPVHIGKVIDFKGIRRVSQLEAAERGPMITMALAVSASGNSIPPFFLFPCKKLQSCFLDNVPSGTVGYANDTGRMHTPDFVLFIRHFIASVGPTIDRPALLLMDSYQSHLSVEALDIATVNGVHILSFPPHCSHKLQPWDVSLLGPLKTYYRSECAALKRNNDKVLEVRHLAGLACAALSLALTPETIKSGFAATGISPYNPEIFQDIDFVQAATRNAEVIAVDADLNEDEQRRIVASDAHYVCREKDGKPSASLLASVMSPSSSFSSVLDVVSMDAPLKISPNGNE